MRLIHAQEIIDPVKQICISSNYILDEGTLRILKSSRNKESSDMGRYVLEEILDNAEIASQESMPLCQDTGVSVFFVKWGQECVLEGMSLQEVLNEAVRQAYQEGFLRKSLLRDPIFDRSNTGDNTPALIHLEQVSGDKVEITFLAKGSGADNCSQLTMLKPSDGLEGVKGFILKVCREAGASSCPPWILGIGIGGTFDTVAGLAKKAIVRDIGVPHKDPNYAKLEEEILDEVNLLGVGPQGLGGNISALAVLIEAKPCHASSLPVAVNIQCHSNRKGMVVI
ncbi:MAG: fumarate hydratase [bacterium]|nr:fumarate hydratase [bacterium]